MRALLPLAALACLAACSRTTPPTKVSPQVCHSDSDCNPGEVCFPDGCGNPERDLAVEVIPNAQAGQNAQDFLVDEVHPIQDIQLYGPSSVAGELTRADTPTSTPQPYTGRVEVRVVGTSALIPGRQRTFGATLSLDHGAFAVPVATGLYSVLFTPADSSVPPMAVRGVGVPPGQVVTLPPLPLPPASSLLVLSGTLVRTALDPSPLPVAVQVQAVDPQTQAPLSQRVQIDPSTGAFTLYAAPEAAQKPLIGIQALPLGTSGTALVPSKLFTVSTAAPLPLLELGDFGEAVAVSGRLLASSGQPLADATVYLDGQVAGGGTFTSASVTTGADGRFSQLLTLASDPAGGLFLWAIPPAQSTAGQLRAPVLVTPEGGELGDFTCPDRVPVQGTVRRPDDTDFPGVRVVATAVAPLDDAHPLPLIGSAQTTTDDNSNYALALDPGIWQLDFIAPEPLPRMSRQVTVQATPSSTGGYQIVQVPVFDFSKGRTVQGTISGFPTLDTTTLVPEPYASVRFFRIVNTNGQPAAELLAEGVTDDQATYSVVLPTR